MTSRPNPTPKDCGGTTKLPIRLSIVNVCPAETTMNWKANVLTIIVHAHVGISRTMAFSSSTCPLNTRHPNHNRLITACKVSQLKSICWTFRSWLVNNHMQGSKLESICWTFRSWSFNNRIRVASSRAYVEKIFNLCFVQKFLWTLGKLLFIYFLKHLRRSKGILFQYVIEIENILIYF
jgi:hypothetical protein